VTSSEFLFVGLAVVWVLIGGYLLLLVHRQAHLQAKVEEVEAEISALERLMDASSPMRSTDPQGELEANGQGGSPGG
jgi:CcmD family protein